MEGAFHKLKHIDDALRIQTSSYFIYFDEGGIKDQGACVYLISEANIFK